MSPWPAVFTNVTARWTIGGHNGILCSWFYILCRLYQYSLEKFGRFVLEHRNSTRSACLTYKIRIFYMFINVHYAVSFSITGGRPFTVYPKKYAHGFVVLCFVVVMQSFIINSHEVFIHIHQGCFAGTGAIVRLPQCQWSKPDGYGKISQCITTTKHSKAKTVCIFLGIYCIKGILS